MLHKNEFEYYKLDRENNESYPLLVAVENVEYEYGEYGTEIIKNPEPMAYKLRKSGPKKYVMTDYHPSERSVVSKKISEILVQLNVEGIQLIPTTIIGRKNEIYEDYFYLHIYNYLSVMDREKSVYKWMKTANVANPIEKLVLDKKLLEKIPLEKRLVFRLKENDGFELFHKSAVDAIMATEPKGVQFTKIEDWDISTPFN